MDDKQAEKKSEKPTPIGQWGTESSAAAKTLNRKKNLDSVLRHELRRDATRLILNQFVKYDRKNRRELCMHFGGSYGRIFYFIDFIYI